MGKQGVKIITITAAARGGWAGAHYEKQLLLLANISITKGFSFCYIMRETSLNSHLEARVKQNKKHLGNTFNYLTGLDEDLQQKKRCLKGFKNLMLIFMQFAFPAPSEHELIHPSSESSEEIPIRYKLELELKHV